MERPWPALALALSPAFLACGAPTTAAQGGAPAIERLGSVAHEPIAEMSGIVKSRSYDGVYWVHNDSGNEARIFAIDRDGRVIFPAWLASRYHGETVEADKEMWPGLSIQQASNTDWEDIALADGRLYIGDIGNNGNARRDLGVYVVNEPNPRAVHSTKALRFLPLRYPEQQVFPGRQWHYDSEALFVSDGKLYLLSRFRQPGEINEFESGTVLYRLDTDHTDRENLLVRVDAHDQVRLASAADVSPDGRLLAVLTYTALWVFEKPASGDRWLSGRARRLELDPRETRRVEALCWDDADTLLLANEQRDLYRVALSSLSPVE